MDGGKALGGGSVDGRPGLQIPGGVLCTGSIVCDILVRSVDEIRWGVSIWVDSIVQQLGGNGANTSFALGKLGVRVRLLGKVGTDSFAEFALARLAEGNVELSGVGRAQQPTATTVGVVNSEGARVFLHRPGASREAWSEPVDFELERKQGFSHLHVGNPFALLGLRPRVVETLRAARAAGLTTSLDTAWDPMGEWLAVIGPCLPELDVVFVNEDEARMLTGLADPVESARFLHQRGARCVVVKLGAKGCLYFDGTAPVVASGFPVEAVDTTGAGDAFAGAFLAGLHYFGTWQDAARLANAVGALSVEKLGATEGIRSYGETVNWMEMRAAVQAE